MSTERWQSREDQVKRVERTLILTPLSIQDLYDSLDDRNAIADIHFFQAIFAQMKQGTQNPAQGKIIPLGGEIFDGSVTFSQVDTQVAFNLLSRAWSELGNQALAELPSFRYRVAGRTRTRDARYNIAICLSNDAFINTMRSEEPDIETLLRVNIADLPRLLARKEVRVGTQKFEVVSSFTRNNENGKFLARKSEINKKDKMLDQILVQVELVNRRFGELIAQKLRLLRSLKDQNKHDAQDYTKDEIMIAFLAVQIDLHCKDLARSDADFDGRQLLGALPYLSQINELKSMLTRMADVGYLYLLIENPSVKNALSFYFQVIQDAFGNSEIGILELARLNDELKKLSIDEQFVKLSQLQSKLSQSYRNHLENIDVRKIWTTLQGFGAYLTTMIEKQSSEVRLHQALETSPKVSTRPLLGLLAIACGVDLYASQRPSREEVFQTLKLLSHAFVVQNIEQRRPQLPKGLYYFIEQYLGEGQISTSENLFPKGPISHQVTKWTEKSAKPQMRIYQDARGAKTDASLLRKAYEVPLGEIADFYSMNFALDIKKTENETDAQYIIRIKKSLTDFENEFEMFLRKNCQKIDAKIDFQWNRKKLDAFWSKISEIDLRSMNPDQGGKRGASQGNRLLLDKLKLGLTYSNGKKEMLEICFYPVLTSRVFESQNLRLFWGLEEKIDDDTRSTYHSGRIFQSGGPLRQSLFELLFPLGDYQKPVIHRLAHVASDPVIPTMPSNSQ